MRLAVVARREHGAIGRHHGDVLALGVARDAEEVGAVRLHAGRLVGARVAATTLDRALALRADAVGQVAGPLALQAAVGAAAAGVADLRLTTGGCEYEQDER